MFGLYGWCDWNGHIGGAYNIGPWPNVEQLHMDWQAIARMFPFLELRSQVFDRSIQRESAQPVLEWRVANGQVEVIEPTEPIKFQNARKPGVRGCTIEQLRLGLRLAEKSAQDERNREVERALKEFLGN